MSYFLAVLKNSDDYNNKGDSDYYNDDDYDDE